jgi:hypothetical protein
VEKWKSNLGSATRYFRTYVFHFSTFLLVPLALAGADGAAFISYREASPIFAALREDLWPAEFRDKGAAAIESAWPAWVAKHDAAIRARVAAGEEDSVVYLLLFGTSFTSAPRITGRELAALALKPDAPVASLPTRIEALIEAIAVRRDDERLQVVREVLSRANVDPGDAAGKAKARQYLETRARGIGGAGLQRVQAMADASTIFRDRGLSSDTTVSTNLGIDRAIADLAKSGLLPRRTVRRVAIAGPGLDFVDKQFGYDFYPPQTIQPFAVIDSLVRSGVAAEGLAVTTFDVSPRVNAHLAAAAGRARAGMPYTMVLPRGVEQTWTPELNEYWKTLGSAIGGASSDSARGSLTLAPPDSAGRVQVRTVMVRPTVVTQVVARDVDVVLERIDVTSDQDRFDLVIATNVLLYYDVFEQSLALANIAAMLRKGGILLSNTRLVELPGLPMTLAGHTDVVYTRLPGIGDAGDRVSWYRRQ